MMAAPLVQAQPQVTVINTGASPQQQAPQSDCATLHAEMAKIRPHELNDTGKRNAADRLRGLIAQENNKFALVQQQHDAEIFAANDMLKQLEPAACCTIC